MKLWEHFGYGKRGCWVESNLKFLTFSTRKRALSASCWATCFNSTACVNSLPNVKCVWKMKKRKTVKTEEEVRWRYNFLDKSFCQQTKLRLQQKTNRAQILLECKWSVLKLATNVLWSSFSPHILEHVAHSLLLFDKFDEGYFEKKLSFHLSSGTKKYLMRDCLNKQCRHYYIFQQFMII